MLFNKSGASSVIVASAAFLLAACNVSDPHEHDEGELITSIRLVLTHAGSGTDAVAAFADTVWFRDPDGPGGAAPTDHDTLRLVAGRDYRVSLSFLNESNPRDVIDMTDEIRAKATDHQVFYTVAGSGLVVAYVDEDDAGLPVGLETMFTTAASATDTRDALDSLTVTLKHQPGLKSGNSTITTGETDVAVTFAVVLTEDVL